MMKLYKGIFQVILANIVNLLISIINGFVLPKYLSIESYADLRTFLLYVSYIGVLHMGFIDGIFIKYGKKSISEVEKREFRKEKKSLFWFQVLVALLCIVIAIICWEKNLFLMAICIIPMNMVTFYKFFFQATGEFRRYRIITNLSSALTCILNLLCLTILKLYTSIYYILINVIISIMVWVYYEFRYKETGTKLKISVEEISSCIGENIQRGFIIMLGNFVGIWITNIDRWFVKITCGVSEFAYYSFAVTMLKLLNVVITAFSVTLYNFFCKNTNADSIQKIRKSVLVIGAVLVSIIFPIKYVIHFYLTNYESALGVIRLIFAAQFVMIPINAVYLNIYKAKNMQKNYLKQMIGVTLVACMSNLIIGRVFFYQIESFALATLLTAIIWLLLCQINIKEYSMDKKEWFYIIAILMGYFKCSSWNEWIGLGIYFIWFVGISLLFFGREIKKILHEIKD